MPALSTQRDREINSHRRLIEQHEAWLHVDGADKRAVAFHKSKIAELRTELTKLEEMD